MKRTIGLLIAICATAIVALAADAKAGQAAYDKSCKSCHGADGTANPNIAKMMKVEMLALGSAQVQALSDDELKQVITNGKGKMPKVASVTGKIGVVDDVVAYVRTLKKVSLWSNGNEQGPRDLAFTITVNRPFEQVRGGITPRTRRTVLQSGATAAASSRARAVASELRVDLGGIAFEASILVSVKNVEERAAAGMTDPMTRLQLEWQAAKMPGLFPFHAGGAFDLSFNRERNPIGFLRRLQRLPAAGACGKGHGVERRCRPPNRGSLRPPVRCRCSRLSQKDAVSARMTIFPRNQVSDEPARKMGSSDNTTDERPSHGIIPKIAPRYQWHRRKESLPEVLKTFGGDQVTPLLRNKHRRN